LATSQWLEQQYGFNSSPALRRLLQRVTARLAATVSGRALERESGTALEGELLDYRWDVLVLRSNDVNAFSLGSGIIVITEGLLARVHSEAQLAAILAHEMSHQLLGHTREAIRSQSRHPDAGPHFAYDLAKEIDADTLGIKIMEVAHYDPRQALAAITLAYRDFSTLVAGMPPDWITARMANLQRRLEQQDDFLPGTENTREFARVHRQLFG
jgi:predicted Zn-dependent protease